MAIKIIECPRDAMQGFGRFINTETKAEYINSLLEVGFHTIDFGSFVSPRAIPQMRDTAKVLAKLDLGKSNSRLLAIVANAKGADDACSFEEIDYLGFPFSVSETFQLRNTNSTIAQSLRCVEYIQRLCEKKGKKLVLYISMGFGNPYGDEWNAEIVAHWTQKMVALGIESVSLSDTVGVATPESISYIFSNLIKEYPATEFGAHLHTRPESWREKVEAAYKAGCKRFDGAIKGFGGCPMATDTLTGNMPTEHLLDFFAEKEPGGIGLDMEAFKRSMGMAVKVFY